MSSPIVQAIKQICEEKNLSYESVLETVESALASAYRKDFGEKNQNLKIEFDPETAGLKVFDIKTVVADELFEEYEKELEERAKAREEAEKKAEEEKTKESKDIKKEEENLSPKILQKEDEEEKPKFSPKLNISLSEAKKIKKTAKINDTITTELEIPAESEFGRMAAQTAKQVITQRLRESERNIIYDEFKEKEHQLITGIVQRREGRVILVDLGRTTGVIPPDGQIQNERYNPGDRIKIYVSSVEMGTKGPEITISRSHPEVIRNLFISEIPEIAEGSVKIHSVSREAGSRSKIAVSSEEENVDPIGSCIGQRGTRIQTIINELSGEKIDIVEYNEDIEKFITNALSPAKIQKIKLNKEEKTAISYVVSDQLSLAIGRGGQNVRLAAHLTGWKITIEEVEDKKTEKSTSDESLSDTSKDEESEKKITEATSENSKSPAEKSVKKSKEPKKNTEKKETK